MDSLMNDLPQLLPYVAYITMGTVGLRVLAEVLNKISEYTDNTWDNKVAAAVSTVSWEVAKLAAVFGIRAGLKVPDHLKETPEEKPTQGE